MMIVETYRCLPSIRRRRHLRHHFRPRFPQLTLGIGRATMCRPPHKRALCRRRQRPPLNHSGSLLPPHRPRWPRPRNHRHLNLPPIIPLPPHLGPQSQAPPTSPARLIDLHLRQPKLALRQRQPVKMPAPPPAHLLSLARPWPRAGPSPAAPRPLQPHLVSPTRLV